MAVVIIPEETPVLDGEKALLFTLKEKTSGLLTTNPEDFILVDENNIKEVDISGKEDTSNKKTDLEANKTSNTFYASCKAIVDWVYNFFIPLAGITVSGRKMKFGFISTGLKISSRSDGSEIGVVLKTDNLTADRTRQEQDKDGTYALVGDITAQNGLNTDDDSNVVELGGGLTRNTTIYTNGQALIFSGGENQGLIATSYQPAYSPGGFGSIEIGIRDDFGFLKSGFKFFRDKMLFISNYGKGIEYGADYSSSYSDRSLVDKGFVVDNFASKSATAKTGTALTFTSLDIYGTFTTPSTTNITVDLTGAKLGIVQKMYHQNGTAPTFPAGFVKISGNYSIVGKNIIYFEFSEGTRVEYWIVNL